MFIGTHSGPALYHCWELETLCGPNRYDSQGLYSKHCPLLYVMVQLLLTPVFIILKDALNIEYLELSGGATPGHARANALAEISPPWQSKVVIIKLYIKIF